MTEYQPLLDVTNPWQAMVAVALVFALLVWPQMSARQTAARVERTLTERNGGSSVVDRFDQLDAKLDALGRRVRKLEVPPEPEAAPKTRRRSARRTAKDTP